MRCVYCMVDLTNSKTLEWDHMPTPLHHGGVDAVPACRGCHDMKDRYTFESWDHDERNRIAMGLWAKMNRDERIMLAKLYVVVLDALEVLK